MKLSKLWIYGIGLTIVALIAIQTATLNVPAVGLLLVFSYFMWHGYITAQHLPKRQPIFSLLLGALIVLSLFLVLGTAFYLLANIKGPIPLLLLSIVSILTSWYAPSRLQLPKISKLTTSSKEIFWIALHSITSIVLIWHIIGKATVEATRGPWQLLGTKYLLLFAFLTFALLLLLKFYKNSSFVLLPFSLYSFVFVGTGVLLFPVGFGYDPFLHTAGIKILITTGSLEPKTLLYFGQYLLTIITHLASGVSVNLLQQYLVPTLFSLTVPTMVFFTCKQYFNTSTAAPLLSLVILTIPVTQFTTSTPYGLSLVFLLIAILWWLLQNTDNSKIDFYGIIFLSIAAVTIHPLGGGVLILWLLTIFIHDSILAYSKSKYKAFMLLGSLVLASFVLPALLIFNSLIGGTLSSTIKIPSLDSLGFTNLWYIESFSFSSQFSTLSDALYLYRYNWTLLFLLMFFVGVYLTKKRYYPGIRKLMIGFGITWLSSVWLSLFFSFSNLITYEQNDFAYRLYFVSLLFALPFVLIFYSEFLTKTKQSYYSFSIALFILTIFITANYYVSYPRYDAYELVRSVTTSTHDIHAVQKIETHAGDVPYVVLANQQVAAAAVAELGFAHYYNSHFYYPIPTGGPLYQSYLHMVYTAPSRNTAREAALLAGVSQVYFVLNDYWFNAENIKTQAVLEADESFSVDHDKVTIFVYRF